jgi:glycosyltransferase involved in cell wall biosynthesis
MQPDLPKKIVLVTDAWSPQVNGVVTTLKTTVATLKEMGCDVLVIEPGQFKTFPCPTYHEIRLAWFPYAKMSRILATHAPDAIHIATEGTLGHAARKWCLRNKVPFTTAYHTQFPEYCAARLPIPTRWVYAYLRRFHGAACRTMVATQSMENLLMSYGFKNIVRWSRGVDTNSFRPVGKEYLASERPIWLYAGRVSVEKNIEKFLSMDLPGSKVVVGDGPARAMLGNKYPNVKFVGYQHGESLVEHMASADVFVFPSRTDTFGLVLLEAMACGVPVAAYPVTGPVDVVDNGVTGVLHEDLEQAAKMAYRLRPEDCRAHAMKFSWRNATAQFINNLHPIRAV